MAAKQAPRGEPASLEDAMHPKRFDRIVRAGGIVPAMAVPAIHEAKKWRQKNLIETNQANEEELHTGSWWDVTTAMASCV